MMIDCSKCLRQGDCCGIIPFPKEFIEKHKDKFQVKVTIIDMDNGQSSILTDDTYCVFLNRKTKLCEVYDDRPEVCRKFGVSDDPRLACEFFKPNGNPRSEAGRKIVARRIKKMVNKALNIDKYPKIREVKCQK